MGSKEGTVALKSDKLKEARKRRNLTLRTLAQLASLSIGYISLLERGLAVRVSFPSVERLAQALDMDIQNLIAGPNEAETFPATPDDELISIRRDYADLERRLKVLKEEIDDKRTGKKGEGTPADHYELALVNVLYDGM